MYFKLSKAVKNRIIEELRAFWGTHPEYEGIAENIQGKYAFKERPQYGIIVKVSSANRLALSADNYQGIDRSYVLLTNVGLKTGLAVEWVREDSIAIQNNGGVFPSPPGVYYIAVDENDRFKFFVDTLLDARNEALVMSDSTTGVLQQTPVQKTLRLTEMPSRFVYEEDINYTVDYTTGEVTLTAPLTHQRYLVADYRYAAPTRGPFTIHQDYADHTTIPGCVIAFGRRNRAGDVQAVMVQETRLPAALEYGGRWEMSLDLEIVARDVLAQEELTDMTMIYLDGVLKSRLSFEGIEITEISGGGESEEPYDDTGDDYYFGATIGLTIQTDWSIAVPLATYLQQITPTTSVQARQIAGMTDDELTGVVGNIQLVESLGLRAVRDPFFLNRTGSYACLR